MVDLEVDDRQRIVELLKGLPEFASESSRLELLNLAGLHMIAPMIDLSGAPFVAASRVVNHLARYGRLTYDNEALGVLLNHLKNYVGVEQQHDLDELLHRYQMMVPIAPPQPIGSWRGQDTPDRVAEKIIGENTLRPIAFLTQGVVAARPVVYVEVHHGYQSWSGTGFMVSSDLLLTNNHVIDDKSLLEGTIFRFNYEDDAEGKPQPTTDYAARPDGLFHTNSELDYTIVQLDQEPGASWGHLALTSAKQRAGDRVSIIQHPGGQPKQISMHNNFVEYVGGGVMQYVTSTLPGSSGSPVFDESWRVAALHHAGGNLREPTTGRQYFRNEGILVDSILGDLPAAVTEALRT